MDNNTLQNILKNIDTQNEYTKEVDTLENYFYSNNIVEY